MKAKLLYLLLFSLNALSQEVPLIKVGKNTISVKKLDVKVSIIGDIAITTFDMKFYNPKNRVLEGELSFPLGENQSVTRFALDLNGNLREAVVVEKEIARVAFENTVRNRIDPALLEKTKGNNYKARIYPIPAKGYKRVVIAFQQKLLLNNEFYFYRLPFNFKNKLENFSFSMEVLNQKNKPISKKGILKEFSYDAENETYYSKINKKKVRITKPILIKITLNAGKEKIVASKDYFYFNKLLNIKSKKVASEKEITIFWDKSLSQQNKKIKSEIEFLNSYFKFVKDCKVKLIIFNTEIRYRKQFLVKNGNWNLLKQSLENIIYDGASSFNFLSTYKDTSNLNFLFTDGLNTLSDLKIKLKTKTHIINSASSANHIVLKNAANISGGKYINLQQFSIKIALEEILKPQLQFLGTNFSKEELEVYPKKGSLVNANFFITGKGNYLKKKIELYFGYGNDTIKNVSFIIKKKKANRSVISKIWAQNKLNHLAVNSKINKEKIIILSKKHQIISPFTSMLILDRIEDYVTHNIEPPIELKKRYIELLVQKVNNKKQRIERLQNDLFVKYNDFFSWYDKSHQSIKKNKIEAKISITDSIIMNNQNERAEVEIDTVFRSGGFFVSGTVTDSSGGLPGVSIIVKGTTNGSETDFDGKYSIKARLGDKLVFRYLGYKTLEKNVLINRGIDIRMEEDESILDEIVITAYAAKREKANVSYAVSNISSENVTNALQGKVSGVQISGNSGSTNNIVIRGVASIKNNKPLFVVDGKVVDNYKSIDSNDIQSIYTLSSNQSENLYGNRGSNGVVVIVTKKGFDDGLEEIEDFETLVEEKLELKGWNPDTPYLTALKKIKNNNEVYSKYIQLRDKYSKSPSFYIDVADFFKSRKEDKIAIQILTNVAEIDLDNYELLKALAYKFEEYKLYEYAVYIYKEILELRPEDIQSYRDLALVYENVGEYQKAVDLIYKIVNGELLEKDVNRRFSGIEIIALNELNRMINLYKKELIISHIDKRYLKNTKTDIRVLIDWNHNDTDIDLWVTDPRGEKCYYAHKNTKIGGLMSDDMTEGFGPEQFILKKAVKGIYKINIKYYASDKQKISGPTFLKITTFKNYGYKNERKNTQLVRLTKVDEVIDIGEIIF